YNIYQVVFSILFPIYLQGVFSDKKKESQSDSVSLGMQFAFIISLILVINAVVVLILALGGYNSHLQREEVAEKEELIMRAMQRNPENVV
ncbi:hypothetical protein PFISCL1PPCAC_4891, partial [Pristionchus fissidentatus]